MSEAGLSPTQIPIDPQKKQIIEPETGRDRSRSRSDGMGGRKASERSKGSDQFHSHPL